MQIYVHKNDQQLGPFTEDEIKAQLAAGTITLLDHVWWQGQANWMPLGQTPLAPTSGAAMPDIATTSGPTPVPFPQGGQTSGLAIAALVSNIVCCIGSIVAIVLGHLALSAMKKDPAIKGRGLALAGLIIGYIIVGLGLAYLILCSVVAASMGDQMKEIFKTISSQMAAAQAAQSANNSDDSSTNSDQSTNAPASTPSTNTPTATPTNQ